MRPNDSRADPRFDRSKPASGLLGSSSPGLEPEGGCCRSWISSHFRARWRQISTVSGTGVRHTRQCVRPLTAQRQDRPVRPVAQLPSRDAAACSSCRPAAVRIVRTWCSWITLCSKPTATWPGTTRQTRALRRTDLCHGFVPMVIQVARPLLQRGRVVQPAGSLRAGLPGSGVPSRRSDVHVHQFAVGEDVAVHEPAAVHGRLLGVVRVMQWFRIRPPSVTLSRRKPKWDA